MANAMSPLWASLQIHDETSSDRPIASISTSSPGVSLLDAMDETNSYDGRGDVDITDQESDGDEGTRRLTTNPAPKPRKISEKRRADTAAFEAWIANNQHALHKRARNLVTDSVGRGLSAMALVQDFESRKIITSPRDYQLELFERAKTQNTIAVLDTGKHDIPPFFYGSSCLTG